MIYVIDIFDHDVGDFIHSVEYADFNCVCADVAEMIDVCDFEDEYDEVDISDELEKIQKYSACRSEVAESIQFRKRILRMDV